MIGAGNAQKLKMLYLKKILEENTDSANSINTLKIISELEKCGVTVTAKTLKQDLKLLQEYGLQVEVVRERENTYKINQRNFLPKEIKLLVDLVVYSKAIPVGLSKEIVSKLKTLVSVNEASAVTEHINYWSVIKSENEQILSNIDTIHRAIQLKRRIHFDYYQLMPNKTRVSKRSEGYEVQPCGLVAEDGNWYLLGVSAHRTKCISPYRVDRMGCVDLLNTPIDSGNEAVHRYSPDKYTRNTFDMFPAEKLTWVDLAFHNSLATVVYDRFGEKIISKIYDEEHFLVTVEVGITKTFISWLFTFEEQVEVLGPPELREQMKQFAYTIHKLYSGEANNEIL